MSEKENENLKKDVQEEKKTVENEAVNELKEETVNIVKQVKESVKNVDIKEETKNTRRFTYRII